MSFPQHIYALADPFAPKVVCYVGRTNKLDQRLRMHLSEAEYGFTIKDFWLMYLRYHDDRTKIWFQYSSKPCLSEPLCQ
ncbi:GIY-YIG nuclease family protein [Planctomycetes bacterium TBK1r]|uniref:GIY-YIG domain-containing protein n=1 Tax=Stieleria magnilauensis TaxID=2527963 RepID=A0ABX5XTM0_9BACT|nr:hypothetical protein TBK1r_43480 [Planctomycetes bacterium TBK1r]